MTLGLLLALSAQADDGQVLAFLINGGRKPEANYQSHLVHLEEMHDVLVERGVEPDRIVVFSSDGPVTLADMATRDPSADPHDADWWEGTRASRLLPQTELVNTVWTRSELRASRKSVIAEAFADAAGELGPGDTLFVYTTDHGQRDKGIDLWRGIASVDEVRAWVAGFDPGVRVVLAMSQCYSGMFVDAVLPGPEGAFPDACGVFSAPANRRAYGCYPEGRDKFIGHGFRLIDALGRHDAIDAAHTDLLVTDRTPDVPLRSSDGFLAARLEAEAARTNTKVDEVVDGLLARAWADPGRFEEEIRLLDDIADAFGTFSPRTLAELAVASGDLKDAAKAASTYAKRWDGARTFAVKEQLKQFEKANPHWAPRLDKEPTAELEADARAAALAELLPPLRAAIDAAGASDRITDLLRTELDADALQWRMKTREGATERMRWLLLRVAGTILVDGTPDARRLERLQACESFAPGAAPGAPPADDPPWPDVDTDLAALEGVAPAWLGVQYSPVQEEDWVGGIQRGAARLTGVMEGSPAAEAGLLLDDVVIGPRGEPFDEPQELRLWSQVQPLGVPRTLDIRRGGKPMTVEVTLKRFPVKLPDLVRPQEGDAAPPVEASFERLGSTAPLPALDGERHLLFWWATWCGPCKLAVPELLAWSTQHGVSLVAITDEDAEKFERFQKKWTAPFPELVVTDKTRRSWNEYGVSATPSFVLVAPDGTIEWRQRGYNSRDGLSLPGWSWDRAAP